VQAIRAGVVNLVPEGLILLMGVTAAVSAFKVPQRGVLAQQLNAIKYLASVDIVCTDKTGTLTEPKLSVMGLVSGDETDERSLVWELATYGWLVSIIPIAQAVGWLGGAGRVIAAAHASPNFVPSSNAASEAGGYGSRSES
jgi:magnesium-transporting ATPase (P-type)